MTSAHEQKSAYYRGYNDRAAAQPMADAFTLLTHTANAYANGYRDACVDADDGRGREGHWE
jgi:hypothetical protein